jgi:flagellum-specific peptidoglycan hydrolase FlgJ
MTPTATKTKNGLQKVKEAEAAWVAAEDAQRTESARHAALLRCHKELEDARRHLIRRDPELVDHLGAPVGEGNPVSDVDKEIAGLDDLTDSAARVEHRREIARSKKQARDALIANNAEAVKQEAYTDDEALRASYIETMNKAAEIAKRRIGICQRLMDVAAICRESNRSVQIEAIAEAERRVRQLAEEPPPPAGGE